jgi:TPR repeat protein
MVSGSGGSRITSMRNIPSAAFTTVGRVFRKDYAEALRLYTLSANQGNPYAIMNWQKCIGMASVRCGECCASGQNFKAAFSGLYRLEQETMMISCNTASVKCSTPEPVRKRMCRPRFPIWKNRLSSEM